ncbi:MAG TPA: hypothetical protein VGC18_10865 [Lacisediminihabitans sp.]|uniref:hypothetical protein n=1 Tax=Lacisediminihabitans sp. TaxID=2787631 RepID=UPI002ED9768C
MEQDGPERSADAAVLLWWLPVGAGGRLVRHTSGWWEFVQAALAGRDRQRLFHAALELVADGERYVVEMAPAWALPQEADRGVVAVGPVGCRPLGRSRLFRYEIRSWRGGTLPDREWAVGGPVVIVSDEAVARLLLRRIHLVPVLTWGRTVPHTGDMWNSNSLVSWLLADAGVDATGLTPPANGRAPGWQAGLAVAIRDKVRRDDGDGG